jgi:RimJ/RimL family protein N-acetyltransferase
LSARVHGVRLEPLDERWLGDVAALIADPEVLRFTRVPEPPPPGFEQRWVDSYIAGRRDGSREGFAAVDADGRFLGLGLAPHIDREGAEMELGYIVARDARGRGAGTAILRLLTRWAFEEMRAMRLYLMIEVENRASSRVAEHCGYRREGVLRSSHVKQGRRADVEVWSRLPTDPEDPPGDPPDPPGDPADQPDDAAPDALAADRPTYRLLTDD